MSAYEEDITREAAIREIRQRVGKKRAQRLSLLKRIKCNVCGKPVSTLVPVDTVIRAWMQCPECIEKEVKYQKEITLFRQSRGPRP